MGDGVPAGRRHADQRTRGTLRIIREGVLDPRPIPGVPEVAEASSGGLMDIAPHPDYATNRWAYFVHVKPGGPAERARDGATDVDYFATTAVGRGRFSMKSRHS